MFSPFSDEEESFLEIRISGTIFQEWRQRTVSHWENVAASKRLDDSYQAEERARIWTVFRACSKEEIRDGCWTGVVMKISGQTRESSERKECQVLRDYHPTQQQREQVQGECRKERRDYRVCTVSRWKFQVLYETCTCSSYGCPCPCWDGCHGLTPGAPPEWHIAAMAFSLPIGIPLLLSS